MEHRRPRAGMPYTKRALLTALAEAGGHRRCRSPGTSTDLSDRAPDAAYSTMPPAAVEAPPGIQRQARLVGLAPGNYYRASGTSPLGSRAARDLDLVHFQEVQPWWPPGNSAPPPTRHSGRVHGQNIHKDDFFRKLTGRRSIPGRVPRVGSVMRDRALRAAARGSAAFLGPGIRRSSVNPTGLGAPGPPVEPDGRRGDGRFAVLGVISPKQGAPRTVAGTMDTVPQSR